MIEPNAGISTFENLLANARPVMKEMQEAERRRPPNFNIFNALGHAYREVQTHSAMLAHLLDPAASHGQETRFLSKFFEVVQDAADDQGKQLRMPIPDATTGWECRREVPLFGDNGQADILLRGPNFILILENKIFAEDQKGQLSRYWKYLNGPQSQLSNRVLVYLTPDGRAPSSKSTTGQSNEEASSLTEALVYLSYKRDILKLIEADIDEIEAIPVAEILRQYASLIRSFR